MNTEAGKRLRICIVMGSHWSRQMGGAQYQSKCIVESMLDHGCWDIHFLASLVNPGFVPDGYTIHNIGRNSGLRKYGGFVWDASSLRKSLGQLQPDIIYQRGLKAYTGLIARFSTELGCPFVFHIAHDDNVTPARSTKLLRHSINKYIDKRVGEYGIRRATAIIAQTRFQAQQLRANYSRVAALVAPNFHPMPDQLKAKPTEFVQVLWVANFKRSKRPEAFVDLAESLRDHKQLRFVMVGRPGDPGLYEGLHRRMDKLDNMDYRGELSIDDVNNVFEKSHLFVNTSVAEGFPNTFIQAWMRKAAVVSLTVDPDGLLSQAGLGTVCKNAETLRSEVLRLATDDEARQTIAELGFDYAGQTHGPAAAKRVSQFLYELAISSPAFRQVEKG